MKNGIVIPCYNESDRLDFAEMSAFIDYFEDYVLCFVNDGSKDDTLERLKSFRNGREDRVYVYDLVDNQGKAEAVRHGVNYLVQETDVQNVGFIDADLSTSFHDYKFLVINLVNQSDDDFMVFGSRKMEQNDSIERSLFRSFASNLVGYSIKKVLGLPINDTQCGAKVFSRSVAEKVFQKRFLTKWLFDVEIFLRMKKMYGAKIMKHLKEIPLTEWRDVEGSKLGFIDSVKIPLMIYKIAFRYTFSFK